MAAQQMPPSRAAPIVLARHETSRLLFRTDTNDLTGGVRRGAGAMVIAHTSGSKNKESEMRPNAFWAEKTLIRTNLQWRSACQNLPAHTPAGPRRTLPGRANALPTRG